MAARPLLDPSLMGRRSGALRLAAAVERKLADLIGVAHYMTDDQRRAVAERLDAARVAMLTESSRGQ